MKKVILFIAVILVILSLVSLRGITGYAIADTSNIETEFANLGISAIGLVIVALVFVIFHRGKSEEPEVSSDVWDELKRAEEEWEREKM